MKTFEVAVIGGGLAGMIAAFALARGGRNVALIAPPAPREDRRTTALMDQSIRFLDRLTLWEKLKPSAAPLATMRIIDGTNRLLRAPTTTFRAAEVGLEAFGYNFPNKALTEVLEAAIAAESNITRFSALAVAIELTSDAVAITLADGDVLVAGFAVGADGRRSKLRETVGIGVRNWSYPQTAMVLNFAHSLPHENISTEFHTESGPFTQVPLPGNRSSLVWVQNPSDAEVKQRRRGADAVAARQGQRRDWRPGLAALRHDGALLRQGPHGADRRSGARLPANRRTGTESEPARRDGAD
jgi:2-octaprenyl-6-methoxyphenol hydroxylase